MQHDEQVGSGGNSAGAIHEAALAAADPARGLRWLDVGCGSGDVLRIIGERWQPASLVGTDVLAWLDDDLDVSFIQGEALDTLAEAEPVDRLLMVEVLEHLEAPWATLRAAGRKLAPGGRLVVTTPNVRTLRHRLELLVRGELTSFRADNPAHLTPALEHVIVRVLGEEGLRCETSYAHTDIVPWTGGRVWPEWIAKRAPRLLRVSLVVTAHSSPIQ